MIMANYSFNDKLSECIDKTHLDIHTYTLTELALKSLQNTGTF